MADFEALGEELARRGKTEALKRLAESEDGKSLRRLVDADAVGAAVRGGDKEALAGLLRGLLSTAEGQRLARSVEELMRKE